MHGVSETDATGVEHSKMMSFGNDEDVESAGKRQYKFPKQNKPTSYSHGDHLQLLNRKTPSRRSNKGDKVGNKSGRRSVNQP